MSEGRVAKRTHRPIAPVLIFGIAFLAVALVLGSIFCFRLFNIPSGSNIPTLLDGDTIVTSKWAYGFSRFSFPIDLGFRGRILGAPPKRGDMVVFKLPRDETTDYVKRVIGLPGDTIQVKDGRLTIDGTVVAREPIAKISTANLEGEIAEVPTYRETLPNGVSYEIVEIQGDTGFNDNTDAFKVPPGQYFVLGDNRDNSLDSRTPPDQGGVGFVPLDNLISKVEFVLFDARHPDRTMKPIH